MDHFLLRFKAQPVTFSFRFVAQHVLSFDHLNIDVSLERHHTNVQNIIDRLHSFHGFRLLPYVLLIKMVQQILRNL